MDNQNQTPTWSTKLGLFTGPLMIILALIAIFFSDKSKTIAYVILAFGLFRTVSSILIYLKQKKNQS